MTRDRLEYFGLSAVEAFRAMNDFGRALGQVNRTLARLDWQLEAKRLRYRASRWRRDPALVLWGGRDVDYQLGARDEELRAEFRQRANDRLAVLP